MNWYTHTHAYIYIYIYIYTYIYIYIFIYRLKSIFAPTFNNPPSNSFFGMCFEHLDMFFARLFSWGCLRVIPPSIYFRRKKCYPGMPGTKFVIFLPELSGAEENLE